MERVCLRGSLAGMRVCETIWVKCAADTESSSTQDNTARACLPRPCKLVCTSASMAKKECFWYRLYGQCASLHLMSRSSQDPFIRWKLITKYIHDSREKYSEGGLY
eukprot:1952507-Rhodomonas_salina.1